MRHRLVLALIAIPLLAACATTATSKQPSVAISPPAPAGGAATAKPTPADDNLNAVLWIQRSTEHDLVYREVYRAAEEKLLEALADPAWDALARGEREGSVADLAPAVIVDVDETVLDNSPYEARLVRSGDEYNEFSWAQWCKEEAARPLAGALEFARFAANHGITVYYLTNRAVDLGPATLDNLRKVGFPVPSDKVFLGLGTVVEGCEMVGTDKGCRRRLIGRDHRVLLQFGDQIVDFVDVLANTPDGREQAVKPYADWIGERWWVLPNPSYGSWEPACFNNDWTSPREARRAAKIKCLRSN